MAGINLSGFKEEPMAIVKGRTLNVVQAAEMLGVSRRWLVREGIRKAKIPYLRPPHSNKLIFLESDLWRVLDSWKQNDHVGTPPSDRLKSKTTKRSRRGLGAGGRGLGAVTG